LSGRKSKAKADAEATPKPKREPTEGERQAIAAATAAQASRPARASVDVEKVEGLRLTLSYPHSDIAGGAALIHETLGTASPRFADAALANLINAVEPRAGDAAADKITAGLALMGAVAPENELETAIGLQIVATHYAALDMTRRARMNAGEYVNSAAAYTNMATKLSRTMAAHVEALGKLRAGGKQTHEVRYVYVNGPAAFGPGARAAAAYGGGGYAIENGGQSHAAPQLAHYPAEPGPEVWRSDPEGLALSGSSGGGAEALPDARWHEPGSPEG